MHVCICTSIIKTFHRPYRISESHQWSVPKCNHLSPNGDYDDWWQLTIIDNDLWCLTTLTTIDNNWQWLMMTDDNWGWLTTQLVVLVYFENGGWLTTQLVVLVYFENGKKNFFEAVVHKRTDQPNSRWGKEALIFEITSLLVTSFYWMNSHDHTTNVSKVRMTKTLK